MSYSLAGPASDPAAKPSSTVAANGPANNAPNAPSTTTSPSIATAGTPPKVAGTPGTLNPARPVVSAQASAASNVPASGSRVNELSMSTRGLSSSGVSAAALAPADKAARRMVLNFVEEAWVEVKDADGKVVFSQLNPAGASRMVSGKAPLSLVVGNAHHVRLKIDDRPFDLKPHIGVTVARFSVQ
jgi:cytoskeleton protein RodZ